MLAGIASLETTRIAERLAKVGGDTYGIYLSHVAIMVLLYRKLQSGGLIHVRAIEVPVVALMSFILAWIFVRLVRRVPFALPLLPGETQRHQLHLRSARDSRIE
jgi:surface polysaccharide O-acyltransferase-like enzyme